MWRVEGEGGGWGQGGWGRGRVDGGGGGWREREWQIGWLHVHLVIDEARDEMEAEQGRGE